MKNIFNYQKLAFWNHWQKQDKILYISALVVLGLSIIFFLFSYHLGLNLLIDWNIIQDTVGVNVPLDEFERNLNPYSLEIQTFFVSQHFEAGQLHINSIGAKIYLLFIGFSAALIITAISMIRKIFWYAVGMTFFFAWLAFMKLDTLSVLGYTNNGLLIICLLLFGGVSFYFHAFKTETPTMVRFLAFLGIILGLGILIFTTSTLAHPYIHLTNYGTIVSSLVTIIFVMMVGYDILNGFFSISLESQGPSIKALINFSIISTLFLANLLLVYLNKIGVVEWDLNFFNPFYLFIISTILGIWANKRRAILVKDMIEFHSAGALLFIGLAINAVMTFGYAFATTNDPMISVLDDTIMYSFMCMGFLFVIYIVMNFLDPLKKGINVYDYVFQAKVVGHFFIRLGAMGLIIFLLGKHHYQPYKYWWGAYHNYIGDVYTLNNELPLAELNYQRGNGFCPLNHKSNYTLASLALEKQDYAKSEDYFEQLVLGKNMSEFAYINLAYVYEQVGKPTLSLFTLQEGIQKFPKSGIIQHNLAYCFQQNHENLLDSIYHYYHLSQENLGEPSISQGNILTFLGQNKINVKLDSLMNTFSKNNPILDNNYLALSTILGQKNTLTLADKKWENDSIANTETSCFLYNYSFTRLGTNDTLLKAKIEKYLQHEETAYPENLAFALACLHYYDNDLLSCKKLMDNILATCKSELYPYYSNFVGTLFYKKYLTRISQEYFDKSAQSQRFFVVNSAPAHYAFNVAEHSDTESMEFPLLLVQTLDSVTFTQLHPIFNNPSVDLVINNWNDKQKFQYLAYHPTISEDSTNCVKILRSFKDLQLKAQTCAMLLDKIIDRNERTFAETLWKEIPQIELYPRIMEEINFQYIKLLPLQYKFKELSDRLDNTKLSDERKLYYYYYKGIAFEALGDKENAKIAFEAAVKIQNLFDKAYIRFVNYLPKEKQYNFLVDASFLLPKSAELQKMLALKALEQNMDSYSEISLVNVQKLVSAKEFAKFYAIYEKAKSEKKDEF